MVKFKYRLKEVEVGDEDIHGGTKSTITSIDPESGAIEWGITDVADFESTYKALYQAKNLFDSLTISPESKGDYKTRELATKTRNIFNDFRTHLRKNYPEAYQRIKMISEESESGFTSGGEGENYAPMMGAATTQSKKNAKSYYKLGFKPVNYKYKLPKSKLKEEATNVEDYLQGISVNNPDNKKFIASRLLGFNEIEEKLNILIPLLQQAKHETIDHYRQKPDSFNVVYGTDLANEYLNDLIQLFKK